jgi:DNA-3-methyladenine glycosylase I
MSDARVGPDGRYRCPWALSAPEYIAYHDDEWGWPVRTVVGLYERLTLEAFQSGLSWLTVLRKRENFRRAFDGFDPTRVSGYGPADVERLLIDPGIIRNRSKIDAAIHNAGVVAGLGDDFAAIFHRFAQPDRPRPATLVEVPATTPESVALAKELKVRGIRFVGPTTAYALMQAVGLVDDHLQDCETAPL